MRELKQRVGSVAEKVRRKPQTVEVEKGLERLSYLLDGLFRVPGTHWRFGLDALVGLIPGVGDAATSLASFYILAAGVRYRVPKDTLLRMGINIAIDYLIGVIPVVGDMFDFAWKSNVRSGSEEGKKERLALCRPYHLSLDSNFDWDDFPGPLFPDRDSEWIPGSF